MGPQQFQTFDIEPKPFKSKWLYYLPCNANYGQDNNQLVCKIDKNSTKSRHFIIFSIHHFFGKISKVIRVRTEKSYQGAVWNLVMYPQYDGE